MRSNTWILLGAIVYMLLLGWLGVLAIHTLLGG